MKRYVYQFWLNLGTSSHLYVKDNLSNNMNSWSLRFQVWLMVQVSDSPFFTFFNPVPYVVESCTIRDGKKWVTPPILWIAIQVGWCHALTRNTFMKLSLDRKSFSSCSNSKLLLQFNPAYAFMAFDIRMLCSDFARSKCTTIGNLLVAQIFWETSSTCGRLRSLKFSYWCPNCKLAFKSWTDNSERQFFNKRRLQTRSFVTCRSGKNVFINILLYVRICPLIFLSQLLTNQNVVALHIKKLFSF